MGTDLLFFTSKIEVMKRVAALHLGQVGVGNARNGGTAAEVLVSDMIRTRVMLSS